MIGIAKTDLQVSGLCLGTVNYGTSMPDEQAHRQLDQFTDLGGNFIDTAHVYGDWGDRGPGLSERVIGAWLKASGKRDRVVIATKGAHPPLEDMHHARLDAASIRADVEGSLRCLGVENIDLYLLHRDDVNRPVAEILGTLEDMRRRGDIRCYGCSNWTLSRMKEATETAAREGMQGFVCNQTMWSLADVRLSGVQDDTLVVMDRETYDWHSETGMSAMAYMGIAKGYFAKRAKGQPLSPSMVNRYAVPSNDAMAALMQEQLPAGYSPMDASLLYFRAHAFPAIPIASFRTEAQLTEAMAAIDRPCPEALMAALREKKQFTV